jgi:hypothetical protein
MYEQPVEGAHTAQARLFGQGSTTLQLRGHFLQMKHMVGTQQKFLADPNKSLSGNANSTISTLPQSVKEIVGLAARSARGNVSCLVSTTLQPSILE